MPGPQTQLTKGLSPEEAAALAALGRTIEIAAGTVLFDLGDPAEELYQVVRGRVVLTLPMSVRGRQEDVRIEERMAGETVGWSALVPPHRFTLKATAPVDTELVAISRTALLEHFAQRPGVAFTITRNVAAVIGQRLGVFQAMWLREMQRTLEARYA